MISQISGFDFTKIYQILAWGIFFTILLTVLPNLRSTLGSLGIGICSFSLALLFSQQAGELELSNALKLGIIFAIPFLISSEFISSLAKSLEILRGSQLAEQLFLQERGGPVEFGIFLLLGFIFLDSGGALALVEQLRLQMPSKNTDYQTVSSSLNLSYKSVLELVYLFTSIGIILELTSGLLQRVTRKNLFGPEISNLRVIFVIPYLLMLLDGMASQSIK